jgi:hypothetical protein
MSAHLTVYEMAIAAERPLRLRAAEQASLAAQADTASGQRFDRLRRHLGSGLRRSWLSAVTTQRWTLAGVGGRLVVEQPAG